MNKRNEKGFTIIELVIVIAVIAILAGVLIPTFASLIGKAKLSADQQVVRNMNLVLQADETDGKPTGLQGGEHSVFSILDANGFNMPTSPSSKGYEYFWIQSENRVVLVKIDGSTMKAVYPEDLAEKHPSSEEDWLCLKNGFTAEEVEKAEEGKVIHVGGVYYESVTEMLEDSGAYEAHNGNKKYIKMDDGSTLKILKDETVSSYLYLGCNIASATVDLGGNKILFEKNGSYTFYGIQVSGSTLSDMSIGTVTLQNGYVQGMGSGSSQCAIYSADGGAFVLKNMTVECLATEGSKYAVSACTGNGSTYKNLSNDYTNYIYDSNIKGGVYCGSRTRLEIYNTVIEGDVAVNGTGVEGNSACLYLENVTILGELTNTASNQYAIIIKSGHFKSLPESKYKIADGSELVKNEDDTFDVVVK